MKRSDERAPLTKALTKFKKAFKQPSKNGNVDFTGKKGRQKYDYVTLDDIIHAIDTGIATAGVDLTYDQDVQTRVDGETTWVGLTTYVEAVDGEKVAWKESDTFWLPTDLEPKNIGSAITYARRYQLGPMLGIASEVDVDIQEIEGTKQAQQSGTTNKTRKPNTARQAPQAVVPRPGDVADKLVGEIAKKMGAETMSDQDGQKVLDEINRDALQQFSQQVGHDFNNQVVGDWNGLNAILARMSNNLKVAPVA
ncbi:hypothetical protein EQG49_11080 [Periweissella cryptocerci]|uniref:Uncharacterized protein n=1 Tax=Periweissella cryptocerci TaxID=2506420 RepID=A0A4P6YVQ9_9LACO|nr:ERF family protein [Periweissella cryptocerci]QBO36949.1 hypothetical protein EQG49_11080 [Periweissella cryptocerci]